MNYIDELALRIHAAALPTSSDSNLSDEYWPLFRIYAVLCRAKGPLTTLEDVHDAWSAWQAGINGAHRSLKLFRDLTGDVQEMDRVFRDAIAAVSAEMFMERRYGDQRV